MKISWFYLIKVKFSGHFLPYTLSAPSCTWFLMIGMLVGLKLFIKSWVWVHICAPVKFLTFFPTWASNRNLIFQAKLQNSLCSCTSWGYMCNTNEICDTYPESSWYKLLKNARKSWSNHKSYCTLLNNFGQKYSKTDTVPRWKVHRKIVKQTLSKTLFWVWTDFSWVKKTKNAYVHNIWIMVPKQQISLSSDINQTMFKVVQKTRIIRRNVKSWF